MPPKKSGYRGRWPKPTSKTFEKEVKKIVRNEIDDDLEDKCAIVSYEDKSLTASIPSGLVFNDQGSFYRLLAPVSQSTTSEAGRKYNTRIGNEITLKHIDLHGYLNYAYDSVGTSAPQNAKLAVRVMIVKAKKYGQYDVALDAMPTDVLLQTSSNASGNVGGYAGNPLDSFATINRDAFSVRYDKVHYLNAPTITYGTTSTNTTTNPSALKMFRHRMNFGKNGLKLTYSNTDASEPENFPYFMIVGYSSMVTNVIPGDGLVRFSMFSKASFQDA